MLVATSVALRSAALLLVWSVGLSSFLLPADEASAEGGWTCSAFDELCEQIAPANDPSGFGYLWRLTRGGSWAGDCTYPAAGPVEGIGTGCRSVPRLDFRAKTFVRRDGKVAMGLAVENASDEPITVRLPMPDPVAFVPLRIGRDVRGRDAFEVGGDFGRGCDPARSSAEATTTLAPGERRIVFATIDTTGPDCAVTAAELPKGLAPVCLHYRSDDIEFSGFAETDRVETGPARTCVRPDIAGCPAFDELCERLSPSGDEPDPRELLLGFREGMSANDCTFVIGGTREIEHVCGAQSPVAFVAKAFVRESGKVAIGLALRNVSDETVVVHEVPFDLVSFTQLRADRDEGGLTQFDVGRRSSTAAAPSTVGRAEGREPSGRRLAIDQYLTESRVWCRVRDR